MIKHTTWCDDSVRPSIILADILNEIGDEKLIKKINILIHKFHIRMNSISGLNKEERMYFMHLHLKETKENIEDQYEGSVQSFLLNVIHALWNNKRRLI
jgi:hypothetical protein